ncbi:DUF1810 domain-containing protein [Sphingomonas sp. BN140010]|uniref:DUF1810 domain-containing protein n=1 Tax=Sphingomonas arvum TaxID=2992113 RepID=A0ABT3JFK5_9SPHN|nr:DUF1810 domain-containing protein [Sphingomonas sp. BN140010]MCW3797806.1 DUF1810 domain-containing protein [Sphingomonas sp. BN140010]
MDDPFNLQRFVEAQASGVYEQALAELRARAKQSHWMWFIFPQHRDLGRSATARFYGLSGVDEARAYLAHPLLGPRLRECFEALRPHLEAGVTAEAILGKVDAIKLRSCAEIFREAAPGETFHSGLERGPEIE